MLLTCDNTPHRVRHYCAEEAPTRALVSSYCLFTDSATTAIRTLLVIVSLYLSL
ncbi:hypothetical protein D3C85_695170 [compost metagenome]